MVRDAQILEHLPDAVFVLTRHGTIRAVNARSARVYGYRRDELIGTAFQALLSVRLRQGEMVRCEAHLEGNDNVLNS